MDSTCEIVEDGRAIHCRLCDRTSWSSEDVKFRYCGGCNVFHDDLVGKCDHCGEAITRHDPVADIAGPWRFHQECLFRLIAGGVAHIEERCSCFGGAATDLDPPGLTKREAAQAALKAWRARHPEAP